VLRYIVRRLLQAVLVLIVISMATYAIFFLLPRLAGESVNDMAAKFTGREATPTLIAGIKQQLGLDKPILVQYWDFVKAIVVGRHFVDGPARVWCRAPCFGYSYRTSQPVWQLLMNRAPVTFSIAAGAAVLWLIGGVAIGVLSALRKGSIWDRAAMTIALAGVSLPIFFTGLVSLAIFTYGWKVLPTPQFVPLTSNPFKWAENLILPWVTLAFLYAALYARLTRAGMLETMNEDYIRTARAKGLPERTVITRHALRGALSPILTIFGLDLGLLLGGAILTEYTFSMAGLGQLTLQGVTSSDLPVVLGVTMLAATFVVLANLIVDVLYAVIDPRVRMS